jgi:L-sorbose 1-phosphate reductase
MVMGIDRWIAYRQAELPIPERQWLWPLYGAGFENLGRDGQPIQVETPQPGADELLVRHDAVGLCFSDTKVIKAGPTHPRLLGRDMTREPVVLGHEVALTVVQVGENLRGQYRPGDRFIVQADIYYKGVGLAYGYALQGGLSQYNVVGKEILEGDEGVYLLPVQPDAGYAQAALTEPWACVVASYDVTYRAGWKPGGAVLIVGGPAMLDAYEMGTPYAGGQPPARVVVMGGTEGLLEELRERAHDGYTVVELDEPPHSGPTSEALAEALEASGQEGFDDIVLLGADGDLYEAVEHLGRPGCMFNLVGGQGFEKKALVDVGRLHYEHMTLVGSNESDLSCAYVPIRTELVPNGTAAFVGAAGPMGQMHVQRALQQAEGPRLIVATDLVADRLEVIAQKYARLIEAREGITHVVLRTPDGQSPTEFNAGLLELTGGEGFDDIVVLAPSGGVVAGAVEMLAENGVMNIFAGLPIGTKAPIDLAVVTNRGVRFTGTSGSAIRDLRKMLDQAEAGELDPNLSVAAISGLGDVRAGLEGVVHQTFPGKIVIYPQVPDFPLTALPELKQRLPNVYAKLGPNEAWTNEAEEEFLITMLG